MTLTEPKNLHSPKPERASHAKSPHKKTAEEWIKANLFNRWYNSVLTIAFLALVGVLAFFSVRFLIFTGNWEPVRENLTLFMIGKFPRADQWRILLQVQLITFSIGLAVGIYLTKARAAGKASATTKNLIYKRFWALALLIVVLLALTKSFLPLLFVLAAIAGFTISFWLGRLTPKSLTGLASYISALCFIISFQILSGTGGTAWAFTAALTAFSIFRLAHKKELVLIFRILAPAISIAAVYGIYQLPFIKIEGIGWKDWSGFHLNLTATVVALAIALPLGILLALGRRSSLPVIRYISVGYIEIVRGVPLIGLLFFGNLFLGFLVEQPDLFSGNDVLHAITIPLRFLTDKVSSFPAIARAILVMAVFTSAYMAEIFRGGFRAVPSGQHDAAKAVGLGRFTSFIWVTFPQAFRAIIPATVGQAISLFKDTSLLTIIAVTEILHVREIVHGQRDFMGVGIAETLIFVSFAFWAISYTMSKESQLLEAKLGVEKR